MLVLSLNFVACSGVQTLPPAMSGEGAYSVLKGEAALEVLKQCSRPAPGADGIWEPTESDIWMVEEEIDQLHGMKAKICCALGLKLRNPRSFHRQYSGILVKGKRFIYVNAFPEGNEVPAGSAVVVCDGGTSYWGALYDPATQRFTNLAFNGFG